MIGKSTREMCYGKSTRSATRYSRLLRELSAGVTNIVELFFLSFFLSFLSFSAKYGFLFPPIGQSRGAGEPNFKG